MRLGTLALVAALVASLTAPPDAGAQPSAKIWRIGFLSLVEEDLEQYKPWLAAFRDGLRQLGYVEGENLVLEQRYAAGRIDRLPALAAELVRLKVDVLVTAPAGSAVAARKATSTVPVVFMGEPDPVGTGLVASLAHPGGNVTGLADAHGDLVPKRLGLLKEVVPSISGSAFCGTRPMPAPRRSSRRCRQPLPRGDSPSSRSGSGDRGVTIWTAPSRRSRRSASAAYSSSATRRSECSATGSPSCRSSSASRRPARIAGGPRAAC